MRRVLEKTQLVADLLLEGGALAERGLVPLVDDQDQRAAGLLGVTRNGGIAGGDSFGGVEQQQHHVG